MHFYFHPKEKGFTLVEIIVSLALFAVVAVIAVGALLHIVVLNQKAQNIQTAMTNLNFALESMSREMREGTNYYCISPASASIQLDESTLKGNGIQSCSVQAPNSAIIAFISSNTAPGCTPSDSDLSSCNLVYAYQFVTDAGGGIHLQKGEQTTVGTPISLFSDVLPSQLAIKNFDLGVFYDSMAQPYPLAFIRLAGYAGNNTQNQTYFNVETGVSARTKRTP